MPQPMRARLIAALFAVTTRRGWMGTVSACSPSTNCHALINWLADDVAILASRQLRGMLRPPVPVEIAGRRTHHSPHFTDLDRLLPRLLQMADTHGHVDTFVDHVHHAIDQQSVDVHQRKTIEVRPSNGATYSSPNSTGAVTVSWPQGME